MYQMIVKLSDEEKQKLEYICNSYDESISHFIRSLINAQYDSLVGNPEIEKMLEQMKEISRTVETMTGRAFPENAEKS